MNIDNQHIRL